LRREVFLVVGFLVMAFNSVYQYSWNALGPLISRGLSVGFQEVQVAFTIFVVTSTAFQLLGGTVADYRGPRGISIAAALMSAAGFLGTSISGGVAEFYAFWALGSAGEGILYGIASNIALKWFPDRRGMAVGLVSLGFGVGGALANPFIISADTFRESSMIIGLVEIIALPALASTISYPKGLRGMKTTEVVRNRSWWIIYLSYVLAAVPSLAFSSSLAAMAKELGVGGLELTIAISAFPLASGAGRPLLGAVSDRIGSLRLLFMSTVAIAIGSLMLPAGLVLEGSLLVGIFGGALVPLYFSAIGEIYGEAYSTANTATLYTGKAIGGIIGSAVFAVVLSRGLNVASMFLAASALAAAGLLLLATRHVTRDEPRSPCRASLS
jgi:OFA family oxalate/formate antiporter-like MFS transporter